MSSWRIREQGLRHVRALETAPHARVPRICRGRKQQRARRVGSRDRPGETSDTPMLRNGSCISPSRSHGSRDGFFHFGNLKEVQTMMGGRFSGKGPKGYTRSDDRINEQVSEKLEENGEVDASEITVQVHQGEVTLEGTVLDRSMKRMAEDVAEDCPGVKNVQNRLRVD
jgi:hypothetical protein